MTGFGLLACVCVLITILSLTRVCVCVMCLSDRKSDRSPTIALFRLQLSLSPAADIPQRLSASATLSLTLTQDQRAANQGVCTCESVCSREGVGKDGLRVESREEEMCEKECKKRMGLRVRQGEARKEEERTRWPETQAGSGHSHCASVRE